MEPMHRPMVVGVLGIMDVPNQGQLPRQGWGCRKVHVVVIVVVLVLIVVRIHVRMFLRRVCVCIMSMRIPRPVILRARIMHIPRTRMNKMVGMFPHMPRLMVMVRHKPMPEEREPPQTKQEIC
jgi:hypothetical protein